MTQEELTPEQLARVKDYVTALRSGEYEQTSWRLARDEGDIGKSYCCEGVAFERYHDQFEGFKLNWALMPGDDMPTLEAHWLDEFATWRVDRNVAPPKFWRVMGLGSGLNQAEFAFELPNEDWRFANAEDEEYSRIGYATLNDDGLTFPQIADLIEWQWIPVDQREVKA